VLLSGNLRESVSIVMTFMWFSVCTWSEVVNFLLHYTDGREQTLLFVIIIIIITFININPAWQSHTGYT